MEGPKSPLDKRVWPQRLEKACHALHMLAISGRLTEDEVSLIKREIAREVRDLFARLDAGLSPRD